MKKSVRTILAEVLNAPKAQEAQAIRQAARDLLEEEDEGGEDQPAGDKKEKVKKALVASAIAFDDPTYPYMGAGKVTGIKKKGSGYTDVSFGNTTIPMQTSLLK